MRRLLILFVACVSAAMAQFSGGSSTIGCLGTPGNTVGSYRQQCQDANGLLYTCNNALSCSVAADWVKQQGSGSFTFPAGTGFTMISGGAAWGTTLADPLSESHGGTGSNVTPGAAGHYLRSNGTHYVDSAIQAADVPTLNQNTTGTAAGLASYPTLCTAGQFSQGLSSGSNNCATPAGGVSSVFGQTGAVPNLSGDVTTSGSSATTLATVNAGPGSCGDASHVCAVTTNNKGLVTSQTAVGITAGTPSYAYHAYTGTSALDLGSFNSVQVTASGGNPTVTIAANPATNGAPIHFNLCNDASVRTWTLPSTFKLVGTPSFPSECVATDANWDGTNYNGPGTNITPSIMELSSTRAAPTQAQCPAGGCLWSDSTAGNLHFFLPGGGATPYGMFLGGVDANPDTGQVTNGSHITNGSVPNSGLANSAITVNGATCTLGVACSPYGGVVSYSAAHAIGAADIGKLVIMNCSSACAVTFSATPAATDWFGVESIGATTATISLNGKTYNGSAGVPALNSFRDMRVASDGSNYFGDAPLVAGTNMTITPASNGVTLTASSTAATAFNAVTSGTNTAAAMVVGSGASLATTGTGTVNSTKVVDSNQASALTVNTTASAVDNVQVTNAATGNPATVTVSAVGSDSNINLNLVSKGTGAVQCNGVACGGGGGSGTVTSVSAPPQFSVANPTTTAAISYPAWPNNWIIDLNSPYVSNYGVRRNAYAMPYGAGLSSFGVNFAIEGSKTDSTGTSTAPTLQSWAAVNGSGVGYFEGAGGGTPYTNHVTGRATGGIRATVIQSETALTNIRVVPLMLTSNSWTPQALAADIPAASGYNVWIVYSTTGTYTNVTDTTHYMICSTNGSTTENCVSTGVTADTTWHRFSLFEDIANSKWTGCVESYTTLSAGTTAGTTSVPVASGLNMLSSGSAIIDNGKATMEVVTVSSGGGSAGAATLTTSTTAQNHASGARISMTSCADTTSQIPAAGNSLALVTAAYGINSSVAGSFQFALISISESFY